MAVQPMPPMAKNRPTVRPCSEGCTWLSRMAISVGKIGPRIRPASDDHRAGQPGRAAEDDAQREGDAQGGHRDDQNRVHALGQRQRGDQPRSHECRARTSRAASRRQLRSRLCRSSTWWPRWRWRLRSARGRKTPGSRARRSGRRAACPGRRPPFPWLGETSRCQSTPSPRASGTTAKAARTRNVRSRPIVRIKTATRIGVTNAPRPNTKSPMFMA